MACLVGASGEVKVLVSQMPYSNLPVTWTTHPKQAALSALNHLHIKFDAGKRLEYLARLVPLHAEIRWRHVHHQTALAVDRGNGSGNTDRE
jgi:hypothetical protein